jgi:hypothetical protein
MSTASVNGITISYDDVGGGPNTLVLVHGHPFRPLDVATAGRGRRPVGLAGDRA